MQEKGRFRSGMCADLTLGRQWLGLKLHFRVREGALRVVAATFDVVIVPGLVEVEGAVVNDYSLA